MFQMETTLDKNGVQYKDVKGTDKEYTELKQSYQHLCDLRDSLINTGVIPAISEWKSINPNL